MDITPTLKYNAKMKITFALFLCSISICVSQTDSVTKLVNGSVMQYDIKTIANISFSSSTTDIKEQETINNVLTSFLVHQNYPNPFNPSTTIEYEIPQNGTVEINIFDIQGRIVQILERSQQHQGKHTILWNGKNISGSPAATGIYFCQVKFGNSITTKKLLLLK